MWLTLQNVFPQWVFFGPNFWGGDWSIYTWWSYQRFTNWIYNQMFNNIKLEPTLKLEVYIASLKLTFKSGCAIPKKKVILTHPSPPEMWTTPDSGLTQKAAGGKGAVWHIWWRRYDDDENSYEINVCTWYLNVIQIMQCEKSPQTYIIYHIMNITCRVCLRITCPARDVALKGMFRAWFRSLFLGYVLRKSNIPLLKVGHTKKIETQST